MDAVRHALPDLACSVVGVILTRNTKERKISRSDAKQAIAIIKKNKALYSGSAADMLAAEDELLDLEALAVLENSDCIRSGASYGNIRIVDKIGT